MHKHDVEMLIVISKSKSFYEAAYALNYSPSVVSKHIARIEKELGVTLFQRSNRASTIALTAEGEALMPDFLSLHGHYNKIDRTLDMLLKKDENRIRIGVRGRTSSKDRDEILAEFVSNHPETRIELVEHTQKSLINLLYMGNLDALFLIVLNGSQNYTSLLDIMKDSKIESYIISSISEMYLGISNNDPLAELDEAPLSVFQDFHITFNSDKDSLEYAGLMNPFIRLSEKSGFSIKPLYTDTNDMSTFYLATKGKVAIPKLYSSFGYPGIKFVKISDWDTYCLSCYLSLESSKSPALVNLVKYVRSFIK